MTAPFPPEIADVPAAISDLAAQALASGEMPTIDALSECAAGLSDEEEGEVFDFWCAKVPLLKGAAQ